ncbi:hypothetical protein OEZ85_012015 [Tetradesmus obliquus]|uniref:Uncharacterized protein n=1 Tax=Tetradesmus obliquus TaxID=3088 RepID=A0ABY8TU84_TETOB|nr:hypothetical protein OEZ85_012015 [Tetradesmus obliquus]
MPLKTCYNDILPLKAQLDCNHTYRGLSVAIARGQPLKHFGHRKLTDLAALWTAKVWLSDNGVDTSHVHVVYTDNMGQPAWGLDNFKPILESLGFNSYEPRAGPMLCFEEVILMPHIFSPKWYKAPGSNKELYMWQAPEMLYDTNEHHIKLLMNIREHGFGLPASIPWAPATNRTVVLASRDPEIRKKAGF